MLADRPSTSSQRKQAPTADGESYEESVGRWEDGCLLGLSMESYERACGSAV